MKKIFCILLTCTILLPIAACGTAAPDTDRPSSSSQVSEPAPTLYPDDVYATLDNKMIAWGLKKNKGTAPDVPESITKILDSFNSVYISKEAKTLYLTFDEGYENGYTAQILDTLKQTNTPAAFFITGDYLKKEPELVLRMVNEGHIIGNHTQNHPSMPSVADAASLANEITALDDAFFELTGTHMHYIRPPKGEFSERTLAISKDLGYKSIFWSFAYADWERNSIKGAQYAYDSIMPYLHDGAILLLHAVSSDNANALPQIIADAHANGYSFKSLDEL